MARARKPKPLPKDHAHAPTRPIDEVRRHPRWGATRAQGKQYQRERELKNELAELRAQHTEVVLKLGDAVSLLVRKNEEISKLHADSLQQKPVPMILTCPSCSARHIDVAFADKVHHTHACQSCGMCWRPAVVPTVGVQFLPGFHDASLASGKGGAS